MRRRAVLKNQQCSFATAPATQRSYLTSPLFFIHSVINCLPSGVGNKAFAASCNIFPVSFSCTPGCAKSCWNETKWIGGLPQTSRETTGCSENLALCKIKLLSKQPLSPLHTQTHTHKIKYFSYLSCYCVQLPIISIWTLK